MKNFLAVLLLGGFLCSTASATELSLSDRADASLTASGPSEPAASVSLPVADPASSTVWMGSGTAQALTTLDAPKPAPALAQLEPPPLAASAGSGIPDSWVYAGLGMMGLATLWACSGYVHRHRAAPRPEGGSQHSGRRTRRVHMLPLRP